MFKIKYRNYCKNYHVKILKLMKITTNKIIKTKTKTSKKDKTNLCLHRMVRMIKILINNLINLCWVMIKK